MSNPVRQGLSLFFCIVFVLWSATVTEAKDYRGFKAVNEKDCVPIEETMSGALPVEWAKYIDFTKKCALKERESSEANIFIISIWINDYYAARFPSGSSHIWENFPLPLIVDRSFHKIGELPEIYPQNDVASPEIYYGVWSSGLPTEIRIDVLNPAVEGDYYYYPMLLKKGVYEMKSKEVKYGRRP